MDSFNCSALCFFLIKSCLVSKKLQNLRRHGGSWRTQCNLWLLLGQHGRPLFRPEQKSSIKRNKDWWYFYLTLLLFFRRFSFQYLETNWKRPKDYSFHNGNFFELSLQPRWCLQKPFLLNYQNHALILYRMPRTQFLHFYCLIEKYEWQLFGRSIDDLQFLLFFASLLKTKLTKFDLRFVRFL